jgi:hypothetical protein
MRTTTLLAVLLLGACNDGGDVTIGTRSDGLQVSCDKQSDDLSACTPMDGDEACETWEDGGAANVLWPPNHKLIRFTLAACGAVNDGCTPTDPGPINLTATPVDPTPARITSITADEAVEVGAGGDGHTTDYDVAVIDDVTFELRSERQGGGDGRVYRVNYVDTDGNPGSCEFLVPHNQGQGPHAGAIDSGTQVVVNR